MGKEQRKGWTIKIEDLEIGFYKMAVGEGKPRITYRNGEWFLVPRGADMYECWTLKSDDLNELVNFVHGKFQAVRL